MAHLAVQAAMLAPVQTKSSQYRDRAIVLTNRHNAAPALLRSLVSFEGQDLVAVVMTIVACRPLVLTMLVHGTINNRTNNSLTNVYSEMDNLLANMTDFTKDPDNPASVDMLYVRQ